MSLKLVMVVVVIQVVAASWTQVTGGRGCGRGHPGGGHVIDTGDRVVCRRHRPSGSGRVVDASGGEGGSDRRRRHAGMLGP